MSVIWSYQAAVGGVMLRNLCNCLVGPFCNGRLLCPSSVRRGSRTG